MKAWVLHDIDDLRLETVGEPVLAEHEVLVEVMAAGICGSDIPRIYKSGAYSYPLIPGHEFSGVVVKLGARADNLWLHRRVVIFPLIPCKNCAPCRKQQYELCRHYSYLGSRRDGGFAEYVAVPQENLLLLPDGVAFEEAAMLEPMSVAVHAIRRTFLSSSDTAVVCGLGTIGLSVLMFLKEAGIGRILAIGNRESQKKAAMRMGVLEKDCCCTGQDNVRWIQEQTDGAGTDVFFECVGKNETLVQALESTAPGGRILLVGNPYTDMILEKALYWKILRNQLTVAGTWNSSFSHSPEDDWHYVLDRLERGSISPAELITHRFPMAELDRGLAVMRDKTEDYIKLMALKQP